MLLKHRKSGDEFLLRTFTSYEEDEIAGFNKLIVKRQKIKCSHVLNVTEIHRREEKNVCSILQKIYLLIEYPFKNLGEEVEERVNAKDGPKYFNQSELLSILYSCCIGLRTLYNNNINHESLTMDEILIDRSGIIKISDPLLLGLEKNYIACIKNVKDEES